MFNLSLKLSFWLMFDPHLSLPVPLCGDAGERPALCGRGSGVTKTNQVSLSAGMLVNVLFSAAGVLV